MISCKYVSSYAIRYFDLNLNCWFVKDTSQFTTFFGGNEVEISLSTSLLHIYLFLFYGGLNHVTDLFLFLLFGFISGGV